MRHTDLITLVLNSSWDMLLDEFIHTVKIIPCTGKKICKKYEHSNTSSDILNAGDNVYDE